MKTGWRILGLIAVSCLTALGFYLFWKHGQPRRLAMLPLYQLAAALTDPGQSKILDQILIPTAIQDRTTAEQKEFIAKALSDEVSVDGIRALKSHAEFGPLKSIFSSEASGWCQQAGVNIDACVAFKMERAGIRAEVVLCREGDQYHIVRCNNVKQMAGG